MLFVLCACAGGVKPVPSNVAGGAAEIRPIFTLRTRDEEPVAVLLACAKVEKGKQATFLDGDACAPLLGNPELELVSEATRVPIKLGAKVITPDCPYEGDKQVPSRKVVGLPEDPLGMFIVGKGTAEGTGEVATAVMELIRKVRPLMELKRQNDFGPNVVGQFDLDGDGAFEIILSSGQTDFVLFTAGGALIASIGCYMG
jgi:hypothetical protein